jgi:hypothetical protein
MIKEKDWKVMGRKDAYDIWWKVDSLKRVKGSLWSERIEDIKQTLDKSYKLTTRYKEFYKK